MEIMPSEYQQLELSRNEKLFIRYAIASDKYGYLLLKVNPAMQKNDFLHILMSEEGVSLFKFFDSFEDVSQFTSIMQVYATVIHKATIKIIADKLISNKALIDDDELLRVATSMVYIFPKIKRSEFANLQQEDDIKQFIDKNCMFCEEFSKLRTDFYEIAVKKYLNTPITPLSKHRLYISDNNINSILQKLSPEYVTVRVSIISNEETKMGVDNELLVVNEDDTAVKAFRLDTEQINIVNKINKGDQLILACAGSGKSVLLIAKCFKAASMNPEKKFLITCYNENLYSLYTWFIDRAGLRAKNVKCVTFHKLCKELLESNGFLAPYGRFDIWVEMVIQKMNSGKIKERFYGIFIDEVQEFDQEWYKFCFNLLEHKETEEHLFVICGDKTQKLKNKQKHGKAPWNVGDGYPNYRGGNKNIRIEKNYRNCIEINEYINRFVSRAKEYLYNIQEDYILDPDMFLRGQAINHGGGVELKYLIDKSNSEEATMVIRSIKKIHDEQGIPYDEIAVIMYNSKYRSRIKGWRNPSYNLETPLLAQLVDEDIPYCTMYTTDGGWASHYGDDGGVKLIKFASVLGLDFRAAIVCGLMPLGEYFQTKAPNWIKLKENKEAYTEALDRTHSDIRNLYVACTRAKEILHIIIPEKKDESEYMRLLEESI